MMSLIGLAIFIIVIGFIAYHYQKKLERLHEANTQAILHNIRLVASSEKLISDYMVLVNVLKDHFTEDEIQKMFEEKRKERFEKERNYED